MKKRKKPSISWRLEEYAFGAAALKEEMERHKKEDKEPWNLSKEIGIRALYVYAVGAALVLIICALLLSRLQSMMGLFSSRRKR